jgi:hypothetical protein
MNYSGLQGIINGLSIVTKDNNAFVAFSTQKSVKVMRAKDGNNFDEVRDVYNAPLDPGFKIYATTLHPSPYGWALQYVASDTSDNGLNYTVFVQNSDDGLDYSGPSWIYNSSSIFPGTTSMSLTPVPMPWIIKTHDSGKEAEEVYNFVITGDGFTYEEKEKYIEAAREMTANIINRAPFYYHKDLFNVWVINAFSKDSGFDVSDTADNKNTIFDGYRLGTVMVSTRHDGIKHARRVITGDPGTRNFYGFMFINAEETETVAIIPWDTHGVPMPYYRANSMVPIHEYMHTSVGGFSLGDHERRNQSSRHGINKSFDRTFSETGSHDWQHWFVFGGPAESRLIEVTDEYRNGLINWVANGNDKYAYHRSNFAYSEDPTSNHYIDALSLFSVGLWESELTDVEDLSATPQYTALRACFMNSLLHHAQIFCPICSEIIVKHLQTVSGIVNENAGHPFDSIAFKEENGAYLEFQLKNRKVCDDENFPPSIDIEDFIVINENTVGTDEISIYESEDYALHLIGRIDLSTWIYPDSPDTITFKKRPSTDSETHLWIPGIQIVNKNGARYPMYPVGEELITRLHQNHAPQCDYEYWDLSEGYIQIPQTASYI